MFGTDEIIGSVAPAYKFDALVRRKDLSRYDDRLLVRTNLIDAYDLLMGFVEKHLDDPFFLEDKQGHGGRDSGSGGICARCEICGWSRWG